MTINDFFKQMVIFFPTIQKELDEHVEEFGERLDTMAIEDIIMPNVINLIKSEKNIKELQEVFDYFEKVSTESEEDLLNIFSITVLEVLGNDKDILAIAKKYMGPITRKYQREADLNLGRIVE